MGKRKKCDSYGTENVRWDLSDIYSGSQKAELEKSMNSLVDRAANVASMYRGRVSGLDAEAMLALVTDIEGIYQEMGRARAFAYLDFSVNVKNPEAGALLQKITEYASVVERELLFFEVEWTQAGDGMAARLLSSPALDRYRHYLASMRRYRPHLLSESEEKLLVTLAPVGKSSWVNLFEKTLSHADYGPGGHTQEEVLAKLYSPDRNERRQGAVSMTGAIRSELHILAHTFNTVLGHKKIMDELRNYSRWDSSMNLANELDDATVDALVDAVTGEYGLVERYYSLKRDILGYDSLYDYDRYAPLPFMSDRIIEWRECREMVISSFARFSDRMALIAERFFDRGWIHAPVEDGKTSGAFAHPVTPDVHPYVLVNYTGRLRDVETVAHELGHGVHQCLAAGGGYLNSQTPLVLAETASVFGEMLVFQDILSSITEPGERLGLLASRIESIFATVFRQIAMNRFENAIHTARRQEGELSPERFGELWMETQQAMFGNSVRLGDDYSLWWAYISHFVHTPGYVYAYAFGELLVLALYEMYREGKDGFTENYMSLLMAGGSGTPYELLSPFGIDLRDPSFWKKGLAAIDELVTMAENIYRDM